jgi:hypothetical protein
MSRKILIIGTNGFLGGGLVKAFLNETEIKEQTKFSKRILLRKAGILSSNIRQRVSDTAQSGTGQ